MFLVHHKEQATDLKQIYNIGTPNIALFGTDTNSIKQNEFLLQICINRVYQYYRLKLTFVSYLPYEF